MREGPDLEVDDREFGLVPAAAHPRTFLQERGLAHAVRDGLPPAERVDFLGFPSFRQSETA